MFTLSRIISYFLGVDRTVDILCVVGWHWRGWELLAFNSLRRMKDDITYIYTFEFARIEVRKANLALNADYAELAWVNADDALAVLEWKGEQYDSTYADAFSLREQAAKKIDSYRLADLALAQVQAHKNMMSNDIHTFTHRVVSTQPWVMKAASSGFKRPRIKERLP